MHSVKLSTYIHSYLRKGVKTDGAVVLGNPVAPPVNGDMYTDVSTEHALLQ